MVNSLKIYRGLVTDINDEDEKGRVQVRVIPELKDVKKNLLPWLRPFLNAGQNGSQYSFDIPEVDSAVWVVFLDEYWQYGYWFSGQFIDGFFDYATVKSRIDEVGDLSGDTSYPNIRFYRLPKGDILFYNASAGELGVRHNTGSYIVFDSDGNLFVKGTKVTLTSELEVSDKGVFSSSVDIGQATENLVKFDSLNSVLSNIMSALDIHTHVDPVSGSTGPPTSPTFSTTFSSGMPSAKANDTKSS